MTYLLQTTDCSLGGPNDLTPADVYFSLTKGVKYISFKITAPTDLLVYVIRSFTAPACAESCDVQYENYPEQDPALGHYVSATVTMKIKETSEVYKGSAVESMRHMGTVFLTRRNYKPGDITIEAINTQFPDQANTYALIHNDDTGVGANEFIYNIGGAYHVGITFIEIRSLYINNVWFNGVSTVTTPNTAVTFTAQMDDNQASALYTWDFGTDVIWVTGRHSRSVTVKFVKPGIYSVAVRAVDKYTNVSKVFDRAIAVNRPATPGLNQLVDFYPNASTEAERMSELAAPARIRFISQITDQPIQIKWTVTDHQWESHGLTGDEAYTEYNSYDLEYLFTKTGLYTVTLAVKYSDTVTYTVSYDYTINAPVLELANADFTLSSATLPSTITADFTDVFGRDQVTKYMIEYSNDGTFSLDAAADLDYIFDIMNDGWVYEEFELAEGTLPDSIVHAAYGEGIQSVCVVIWTANGIVKERFRNIGEVSLAGAPTVSFLYNEGGVLKETMRGNLPLAVRIDISATDMAPSDVIRVDLGDGTIVEGPYSENAVVFHTYTTAAIRSVSVTATNSIALDIARRDASVEVVESFIPYPIIKPLTLPYNATLDEYVGIVPQSVTIDLSESFNCDEIEIQWGFDETVTVTPVGGVYSTYSHTFDHYDMGGTWITVVGRKGENEQSAQTGKITNYVPPIASFAAVPNMIVVGESVDFVPSPVQNDVTYFWTFGDGGVSSEVNPTHVYLKDGIYSPVLTVTNPAGTQSLTKTNEIVVGVGNLLAGEIGADVKIFAFEENPSAEVNFTFDGIDNENLEYVWEFGDGSVSNEKEPTYTYTNYGEFPVKLTIKDSISGTFRTITEPRYIRVRKSMDPTADFEILNNARGGTAPFKVTLIPRCTGEPATYYKVNWGDSPFDETHKMEETTSISHVYGANGKYSITFTALNEYGSSTIVRENVIVVSNGLVHIPTPIIVVQPGYDTSTPLTGTAPLTVQFIDKTEAVISDMVISWLWTFGDGGSSTQQHPEHTFLNSGSYRVTLKIGTRNGHTFYSDYDLTVVVNQDTIPEVVTVVPNFMTYHTIGVYPFTTTFFDISEGNPTSWSWLFGDEPVGTAFPEPNANSGVVKHTYNAPGIYPVKMKAYNSLGGVVAEKRNYIIVSDWATAPQSIMQCEPNLIGDILVQAIDAFNPSGENEEVEVKNKNTLRSYAYTIPNILENVGIHGFIWTDGKTEDEFAEDLEATRFRDGSYNYIDVAGKRGFLAVKTVDIPKEAETQTMRDFDINGKFMSATMFERSYTMETSIYNQVINGVQYNTDHPPTIALPVNSFNVKIKSPWQTIALKEPTYVMNSSEGQIPIYMPFKLYTTDDPSVKYSPAVVKFRPLEQYGYGVFYIPPKENNQIQSVSWHANVGVDVPLGKYRIAVKLASVPYNNQAQNVPEIGEMLVTGNNMTDNSWRMIVWDKPIPATLTDDLYYSDEIDLTSFGETININISNTRTDTQLQVKYMFLVPMYHAKLSFDAYKEYYTGEMKVYDYSNGVAKRVYNVNHEFKGSIYICNAFMRWIIDPNKKWIETGDITHTQYKVNSEGSSKIYLMDDKKNMGTQLCPVAYYDTKPSIVFKKILPNIVEFDLAFSNGSPAYGADVGNMVTTVHALPYTFKYYNKRNGDMTLDWQLVNKHGFPAFNYFNGTVISKFGDSYDRTSGHTVVYDDDTQMVTNEMPSIMTVYNDYLYMLSFGKPMQVRVSYSNNNITFPAYRTKGNYQFSLNVFPMYTDKYYNYSDDLVCTNDSMQRKVNSCEAEPEIVIDSIVNSNIDSFWNLFESMYGDANNISVTGDGFTVNHTNQYDKGYMYDTIRLQNKHMDYMKMDFDVKMDALPSYVSSVHYVLFKPADGSSNHTLSILNNTTYNLRYVINDFKTGVSKTYYASVDLKMLEEPATFDHVSLEVIKDFNYMSEHDTIVRATFNGLPVHWSDGVDTDMVEINVDGVVHAAPIEIRFNQMYGCQIHINNMTIRPYLTSYQHFKNYLVDNMMRLSGGVMVPNSLSVNRHAVFEAAVTDASIFNKTRDNITGAWLKLKNNAKVILKSYKMKSGRYRVRFMPVTANTLFTFYVSTNLDNSGPIDSVYYEIPTGLGTCSLKHTYEDGTTTTIESAAFAALTLNTLYEAEVNIDDKTGEMSLYIREMSNGQIVNSMITTDVDPIHIKYGKIGFKSDKEIHIDDYDLVGIEKFGRGAQICRYIDDFDFAYGDIESVASLGAYGTKPTITNTSATKIYACNYGLGGEGVAYHDTTSTNLGSAKTYRTGAVDLTDWGLPANISQLSAADKTEANKVVVSYTATGEWLKYPVNVTKNGTYTLSVRASNGKTSIGKVKVTVADGPTVTLNINPTGKWATFQTVSSDIVVPYIGVNEVVKVEIEGDINLMWLTFTYKNTTGAKAGATTGEGPSNLFKTEYQPTNSFAHDLNKGVVYTTESDRQLNYLCPVSVHPFMFDSSVMIKSTRSNPSADHRGGLIFNVDEFSDLYTPNGGYAAYLNFKTGAVEMNLIKKVGNSVVVESIGTKPVSKFAIAPNRWYNFRVVRQFHNVYVYVKNALGVEETFNFNINIAGKPKYDTNGNVGFSWYGSLTGMEFDDFDIDRMQFKNTDISMVSIGGVSHGGEYDIPTTVFDKVVPNVTIPYGYYYIVANAHSTTQDTTIHYRVADFTNEREIIVGSMELGTYADIEQSDIIGRTSLQFAKLIVEYTQASKNAECGIEIYQPIDVSNYAPAVFVNYIIMIPFSGTMGKQIFMSELDTITKSPSVVTRKLDEKKIA